MSKLAQHSLLALSAHQSVVRKLHVSEKVDAFSILHQLDLVRVQFEPQLFLQKLLNRRNQLFQFSPVIRYDHEVIGIPHIVLQAQLLFYKMIEIIHVHIDETMLEDRIEDDENSMVQHAVAYRRFVNVPEFGVGNVKAGVCAVFVRSVSQVAMQLKNMLLEILFKLNHITLLSFLLLEAIPCYEQMLGRDHAFEYVFIRFHI